MSWESGEGAACTLEVMQQIMQRNDISFEELQEIAVSLTPNCTSTMLIQNDVNFLSVMRLRKSGNVLIRYIHSTSTFDIIEYKNQETLDPTNIHMVTNTSILLNMGKKEMAVSQLNESSLKELVQFLS